MGWGFLNRWWAMGEITKIQWTDHTFNPWRGCAKVHTGCANCYAEAQAKRNPGVLGVWGPHGSRVIASESKWREPLKWNRDAEKAGERRRVFCASLADVFEDSDLEVRDSRGRFVHCCERGHYSAFDRIYAYGAECECGSLYRAATLDRVRKRLFALIDATPWLDWQLLTKRPENVRRGDVVGHYRPNVWLGVSVSDQATADKYISELLKLWDLTPVLFVSAEPLVGPIDIGGAMPRCKCCGGLGYIGPDLECGECGGRGNMCPQPDWLIVGGESGPNARPCNVDWIRSIVRQCKAAGVACFVKQLGTKPFEWDCWGGPPIPSASLDSHLAAGGSEPDDVWRPLSMRDRKGGDPAEWPEELRVREFP